MFQKLARCIYFILFILSQEALAGSWLFQLAMMRPADEVDIQVVDGVVDLKQLDKEKLYNVKGDIFFNQGSFFDPKNTTPTELQNLLNSGDLAKVPLNLKTYPNHWDSVSETFGSFIIKFSLSEPQNLGIRVPRFYHPIDLYLVDQRGSRLLLSLGEINTDPKAQESFTSYPSSVPAFDVPSDFYLVANVSSPLNKQGQSIINFSHILIGDQNYTNPVFYYRHAFLQFVGGVFFLIAFFYGFIFLFRSRDTSSLFVAVYALCSFFLVYLSGLQDGMTPELMLKIFTNSNVTAILCLQLFIAKKIYPHLGSRTNKFLSTVIWFLWGGFIASASIGKYLIASGFMGLNFIFSYSLITFALVVGFRNSLPGFGFLFVGCFLMGLFHFPILIGVKSSRGTRR